METITNHPDEAAASEAVSSFITKHFSKMALSLGSATIFESDVSEIGFFDIDVFDYHIKAVVGGDSDYNDEDLNRNEGGEVIKKRKVLQRFKKLDSLCWRQYLNTEAKATMEKDPDHQVSTRRFRRNFRVPYGLYNAQILGTARERWWPNWPR
jgi:hypothetical protein